MISIVFSVAGKYDLLHKAIDSLPKALAGEAAEVIVVDSGYPGDPTSTSEGHGLDTDRDRAWALHWAPHHVVEGVRLHWIDFIEEPHNLHRQWNIGLHAACGDVLCYFNDDVEFAPGCLARCASVLRKGQVHACYPTCFNGMHERHLFDEAAAKAYGSAVGIVGPPEYRGYALIMSRETWETVGPFDEQFNWGRGDFDYFARLMMHKRFARQIDGAYLFHHGQATLRWFGGEYWTRARDADRINCRVKWGDATPPELADKDYDLSFYAPTLVGDLASLGWWLEQRQVPGASVIEYDPVTYAELRRTNTLRAWNVAGVGVVTMPGYNYPIRPPRSISIEQFMIRFAPCRA